MLKLLHTSFLLGECNDQNRLGSIHSVCSSCLFTALPADQVIARPDAKDAAHSKVGTDNAAAV